MRLNPIFIGGLHSSTARTHAVRLSLPCFSDCNAANANSPARRFYFFDPTSDGNMDREQSGWSTNYGPKSQQRSSDQQTISKGMFRFTGEGSLAFDFTFQVPYPHSPTAILGWPPHPSPPRPFFPRKSQLLDLPLEMLEEVLACLPSVATLALSSTCRALANLLPRSALLSVVLEDPKLRYDLHCLGERDGHSGSHLACDYCNVVHQTSRFPKETARLRHHWEKGDRTCVAGLNSVEIFPNFWFSHQDLRLLVEWLQKEPAVRATGSVGVSIASMHLWNFATAGLNAFELIKKCEMHDRIPSKFRDPSPYSRAAFCQSFAIYNGNNVVSHTEYSISLHAALRDRFQPPPRVDPINEALIKEENVFVSCPHFGLAQLMVYIDRVRDLFPNLVNPEAYSESLRKLGTTSLPLQTRFIKCQSCSCLIILQPCNRTSSYPKGPRRLTVTVEKELGPPDQADNILWVQQLPAKLGLRPD